MRSAHIPCLTTLLVALAASPASAQMSDVQRDRVVYLLEPTGIAKDRQRKMGQSAKTIVIWQEYRRQQVGLEIQIYRQGMVS